MPQMPANRQSATRGMFKNMSLLKARAPGVLPSVVTTVVRMACMTVAKASSIMSRACIIFWGGLLYKNVLNTFPTVWCICLQVKLDWGFCVVDCTFLTLKRFKSHWNSLPMNSPPLSCTHLIGRGYLESQDCTNLFRICSAVLLSIQINLTKLDAVSMHVRALNSTILPCTFMFHGKIRSMATSSQGAIRIHLSCSHLNLSMVRCNR